MVNSFFSKIILPGLFPVLLRQPSDLCHAPIIPIVSHSVPGRARILRFALLCPWRKCRKQSVCPNSVRPCLYILRRKLSVLLRCLAAECSGCLLLWLLGIGQDAPHGGRGLCRTGCVPCVNSCLCYRLPPASCCCPHRCLRRPLSVSGMLR